MRKLNLTEHSVTLSPVESNEPGKKHEFQVAMAELVVLA